MKIKNMNYGIKVPSTIDEAAKLDKENNNTLWKEAIEKELNV